uniref:Methyltransferase type 12 n=1 Tax=Solibacter usitatus (strain Ellin6076) TaxID=234267 RepID=Q01Y78_SOLUE
MEFQAALRRAKHEIALPDPGWYPWDSFGTVTLLDRLLTGPRRFPEPMLGTDPVLDIGCGDGDLSFFLESFGYRVCAIDTPPTNFNRMAGVNALKTALDSSVRIEAIDLDRGFEIPIRRCGLALFFGILYHLKNPYGVLESLASHARYCLLSTAITRFAPDQTGVNHLPVAFLAGGDGLRGDGTNYWIFSESGLRTLLDRTGWEVCDWMVSAAENSVLWETQRDERVICLLRSRSFDATPATQLVDGWHVLESGAWRWTERRFSLSVAPGNQRVALKVTVPENLAPPLILTARVACDVIATHELPAPGDYECAQHIPPGPEVLLEFELGHALPPDAKDGRERGILVRDIEIG